MLLLFWPHFPDTGRDLEKLKSSDIKFLWKCCMFLHSCSKFQFFFGIFGSWYIGMLFKIKWHHSCWVAESEGDKWRLKIHDHWKKPKVLKQQDRTNILQHLTRKQTTQVQKIIFEIALQLPGVQNNNWSFDKLITLTLFFILNYFWCKVITVP